MNVRTIPRTLVERWLAVVRAPVDLVSSRLPDDTSVRVAVDRADATVRALAGRVLRDEDLQEAADRLREAADDYERAAKLRAEAALTRERADEEVRTRTSAAKEQQKQADQKAAERAEKVEEERRREEAAVEKKAAAKKQAVHKSAAKQEEAIDSEAKRVRLAELAEEADALEEHEKALRTKREAERLQDAAARAKEERKTG